jgi:site-specific DNA recombinase
MNIALYARVSTGNQQQKQTIEQQLTRLRACVEAHPDWHLSDTHIYRDDGYTGASLNRPGLDRLREQAAMAAFELVLITAPDRLARKYVHQLLLMEELVGLGCQIEFVERPMKDDDPHDQLVLHIRGAVAEYERSLIADRMRRGRQAKLRNGMLLPWTVAPYGYLLDAERPRDPSRVQIDPVKAAVVQQIFAWYTDLQQSVSLYGVAKQLNDDGIPAPRNGKHWSAAAIRGILRNPAYTGTAYSGRTRSVPAQQRKSALQPVGPGVSVQPTPPQAWIGVTVPALIAQETFDLAQQRLEQNKQLARRNNHAQDYLLRSLVSCGQCQLACTGRTCGDYIYYVCCGRSDSLGTPKAERCTARYVPARQLDDLIWQDLCTILTDPACITHELARAHAGEWLPQALQARRQTLNQAIAQLERQQARLLDVYLAEVIGRDEFERKRQELTHSYQGLQQQLRQLEAQVQKQIDLAALTVGIQAFCQRIQTTLDDLDFAQRRQLVELLVDRVVVNDDQVEIRYVIPTSPNGEISRFCHLRKDYFDPHAKAVELASLVGRRQVGGQEPGFGFAQLPEGQKARGVGMLLGQQNRIKPVGVTWFGDETVTTRPDSVSGGREQMTPLLAQCVAPAPLIQQAQHLNGAKLAITGQLHVGTCRDQAVHIGQQGTLFPG